MCKCALIIFDKKELPLMMKIPLTFGHQILTKLKKYSHRQPIKILFIYIQSRILVIRATHLEMTNFILDGTDVIFNWKHITNM